jgi:hypothetical protein
VKLPDLTADKTATQAAMVEAVLHERRLELAFEGQRWFDLVRNGKVEEYMNGLNQSGYRTTSARPKHLTITLISCLCPRRLWIKTRIWFRTRAIENNYSMIFTLSVGFKCQNRVKAS